MITKYFEVKKENIALLKFIIEAYAHHAIIRTLNPKVAVIEIIIAEDYHDVMRQVIESIKKEYGIRMNEVSSATTAAL